MTNPFEDPDATYLVVVNDENQHALWPTTIEVPADWTIVHPEDGRDACLSYIERNWSDRRPRGLAEAMDRRR